MDFELIPAHLRRFVVQQDYRRYTSEDQAVWRFAVLNTHARLRGTAHPAYADGFAAAGISVEAIPRIEHMSECLARFGWHAVAVDGFIPPRAFQEFQAQGILPIAADIRTSEHLTYTPAPDIIHEAAGHAPFLADPDYARYLRRIGATAEKAFASKADARIYEAIYMLSEVKEDPARTPQRVADAERALLEANAALGEPSESAKMARLYWWTAEYGLVGTISDYRLYGAGLLSSIGEGHFCRQPNVRKLPLSAACIEQGYDITQAQPQLFVARDFADLERVLDDVAATLAHRRGGKCALEAARDSNEVATIELSHGLAVAGVVAVIHEHAGEPCWVELAGPCRVAERGSVLGEYEASTGYALPLAALADGTPLSSVSVAALARYQDPDQRLDLPLSFGLSVRGRVRSVRVADGRVAVVGLDEFELERAGRVLFRAGSNYPLVLAERVVTASAAAPRGFFPPSAFTDALVPKQRTFDDAQRQRIDLYDRALAVLGKDLDAPVEREFEAISGRLATLYPQDWLLRWNLLESLVKLGKRGPLAKGLESELERLEVTFDQREPIATGLGYIRALDMLGKS